MSKVRHTATTGREKVRYFSRADEAVDRDFLEVRIGRTLRYAARFFSANSINQGSPSAGQETLASL